MPIKANDFSHKIAVSTDYIFGIRPSASDPREEYKILLSELLDFILDELDPDETRTIIDVYSKSEADVVSKSDAIKFALVLG